MDQTGNEMLEQILSVLESFNYCKVTNCINCQKWQHNPADPFNGYCLEWKKITHYDQHCSEAWGNPESKEE